MVRAWRGARRRSGALAAAYAYWLATAGDAEARGGVTGELGVPHCGEGTRALVADADVAEVPGLLLAAHGIGHGADKIAHEFVALVPVYADAMLDGHGHGDGVDHGLDAVGHQRSLVHQAGTERATLNAFARAAAVEVHFVVAPLLGQLS
mgnify:CR=1 FL=1